MKNLFSSTYILLLLFFILSCDDQMGVVEILSLNASDSTIRTGKEIILNCDAKTNKTDKLRYSWESSAGTVISGNKDSVMGEYIEKRQLNHPRKGPFYPRMPHLMLKRAVRGMIPYQKPRGREAFKR